MATDTPAIDTLISDAHAWAGILLSDAPLTLTPEGRKTLAGIMQSLLAAFDQVEQERDAAQDEAQENWQSVKKWKARADAAEASLASLQQEREQVREARQLGLRIAVFRVVRSHASDISSDGKVDEIADDILRAVETLA